VFVRTCINDIQRKEKVKIRREEVFLRTCMKWKGRSGYRMRGRKNKREKEGHKEIVREVQCVRRSDTK
jgi:hypothetical protein